MNPALRGAGKITAVFFSPDGELAAVASAFPLLINPRARAVYGGATLRYRVGLYRRGEAAPFATFDALRLPVNDVAFHPTRPAIAIGAGSYDGGYLFEGDLVIWNWADGRSRRPCLHVPEVVRCRYLDDAGQLEAWVRPWDESWDEDDDRAAPAADTLLRIRIDDSDAAWRAGEPAALDLDETTAMVDATPPDDGLAVTRLADWSGLPDLGLRGAIWDLAWLDADTLGATHDACLLDRYDRNGELLSRHEGGGRGSEILPAAAVTVHALAPPIRPTFSGAIPACTCCATGNWRRRATTPAAHTHSRSTPMAACWAAKTASAVARGAADILLDPALAREQRLDVGHYDCFNHYIGINGAPCLFALQGTPPGSHEGKYLCIVHPDGRIERLWPVLKPDRTPASHAMECRGAYVDDALGAGVVIAGKHYSPTVDGAYRGFIYRKSLARGQERWRHATPASASAIVLADGLVTAAFLDGSLMLIDARTGDLRLSAKVRLDGIATVIYAMAARDGILAIGTLDGRIALARLADLPARTGADGNLDLA